MTLEVSTAEIVECFYAGQTIAHIAKKYDCHRGTVLYRLNQAGARSRTRARVNARTMLQTFKPTLVVLLAQLEQALETVREEFIANAVNKIRRQKYIARINRLEEQIHALKTLTTK